MEGLKDSKKYEGMYETAELDALRQALHIVDRAHIEDYLNDAANNPIKHEKLKSARDYLNKLIEEAERRAKEQRQQEAK